MDISRLLGLSKKQIEHEKNVHIVSVNNVNRTIEVADIQCNYVSNDHHALFYFDLTNDEIMTMAVLKLEDVSWLKQLELKHKASTSQNGYVGVVTATGRKGVVIAYIKENILKAL